MQCYSTLVVDRCHIFRVMLQHSTAASHSIAYQSNILVLNFQAYGIFMLEGNTKTSNPLNLKPCGGTVHQLLHQSELG